MATIGRVLLIPKGDYSGSAIYNKLDWVRDNGKAWVCKVDGTQGVTPTEGANWTLLAADGNVSGSVEWSAVNNKPFSLVDTDDFEVDANDVLKLKNGGGTGDTVSWSQIQTSTGATNIADITINGTTQHVYAPTGGGSSTLGGLTDVTISSASDGEVLTYDDGDWINAPAPTGGHTMINNSGYVATMKTHALDDTDDDVASVYAISNWSNCAARLVLTTASQGDDGVGTWLDTDWESGTRSGWLWSEALYHVLDDGASPTPTRNYDVEIIPVFDTDDGEVISLYAMRIDDDYPQSIGGVAKNGGCIAFKFNGEIQNANGVKVGVKLVYQRTEVVDTGRIIS